MKPCKAAYKMARDNDNEIYKGFGFKHLSDATAYYVHRNNESYKGTTTLCQTIGESITFMAQYISSLIESKNDKDCILVSEDGTKVWIDLTVPDDWRKNGITDVYSYKAQKDNSSLLKICPCDINGNYIRSSASDLSEHYKLLPVMLLLISGTIYDDDEYAAKLMEFVSSPNAADFVALHEDLYQKYKNDEYILSCRDISAAAEGCNVSLGQKLMNIIVNSAADDEAAYGGEIKAFEPADFLEVYRELIPELSEEFRLPPKLKSLCSAVAEGDIRSVLLYGPAGTGKTMSCKLICRETGLPLMETVNCTENLDEFILGKYLPEDDKIVFKESFVTKAVRYGGAVIFEEINFARPQYLAFLNSLLDDNGFVRLDSGEVVRRHKNFRFFATMNIGYYGTRELNQALYNRFNAIAELDELSDEAISSMLAARIPLCKEYIKDMLEVYHRIKHKAEAEGLDLVISPRNLENWARMAKYEGYIAAAEKTIIPVARGERSLENMIRKIVSSHSFNRVNSDDR